MKSHHRPPFDQACEAWTSILKERGLSTDLLWVFDENLCFRPQDSSGPRLGFQTRFTPPPAEAPQMAFDYFAEFDAPLVFYRIGTAKGRSVCLLLCDRWFESKGEAEGFVRRDDWLIYFRPGGVEEIPEVTDEQVWKSRVIRNRPLHDLDFCMSLRAVHEVLAHGRVLTTYERYALKFFHVWWRLLGQRQ
jgi:hypothetical protein